MLFFWTTIWSDIKNPKTKTISASVAGTTLSVLDYSPDFEHEHDGERCLSDALTQDWIGSAGIADEYHAQEVYQNNLANYISGGDRASYTIPIIFHIVYNTPEENISEADINTLLDAVNEDFSASNSDIGEARGGFGFVGADVDIEFCLAKQNESGVPLVEPGINRVATSETWYNPDTETNKMKSSVSGGTGVEGWDRGRYLNVWVCDITNGGFFRSSRVCLQTNNYSASTSIY